ncbi:hypothetical protein D3C78_1442120 [compost metagenome]
MLGDVGVAQVAREGLAAQAARHADHVAHDRADGRLDRVGLAAEAFEQLGQALGLHLGLGLVLGQALLDVRVGGGRGGLLAQHLLELPLEGVRVLDVADQLPFQVVFALRRHGLLQSQSGVVGTAHGLPGRDRLYGPPAPLSKRQPSNWRG